LVPECVGAAIVVHECI